MRLPCLFLAAILAAGSALGAELAAPRVEQLPLVELPAAALPLQAEAASAGLADAAVSPASLTPLPQAPALERAAPFAGITRVETTVRWAGAALGAAGLAAAAFDGSAWPVAASALAGAATAFAPRFPNDHTLPYEERQRLAWRIHERLERLLPSSGLPGSISPRVEVVPAAHPFFLGVQPDRIAAADGWASAPDEELDSALAHELGHLYFDDLSGGIMAWTRLASPAFLWAGYAAAASAAWLGHDPLAWAAAAGALAAGFAGYGSSRLRERRADLYSALLADPSGLISALGRWVKAPGRADSKRWWIFGRMHPKPAKRQAYLRAFRSRSS